MSPHRSSTPSGGLRRARRLATALALTGAAAATLGAGPAAASLDVLRPSPTDQITFYGHGGYSSDGIGESDGGSLRADVPAGSTVRQAYLYGSYESYPSGQPSLTTFERTVSFDGAPVVLTEVSKTDTVNDTFYAARADVTTTVAAQVGGGGAVTSFAASGPPGRPLHGLALVVIYENPASPRESIAILDGFASPSGDNAKLTYSAPLNTGVAGFRATMALGIGWSAQGSMGDHACYGGQASTVDVNSARLASCAGNADDSPNSLITVGGVGDSFTNPTDPFDDYDGNGDDDELYDLAPFVGDGDAELNIDTTNASQDDNVFLAVIEIAARASAATNGQTPPAPPVLATPPDLTSTGVGTAAQHQSTSVPADGSVHLLDGGSEVATLTVAGQGRDRGHVPGRRRLRPERGCHLHADGDAPRRARPRARAEQRRGRAGPGGDARRPARRQRDAARRRGRPDHDGHRPRAGHLHVGPGHRSRHLHRPGGLRRHAARGPLPRHRRLRPERRVDLHRADRGRGRRARRPDRPDRPRHDPDPGRRDHPDARRRLRQPPHDGRQLAPVDPLARRRDHRHRRRPPHPEALGEGPPRDRRPAREDGGRRRGRRHRPHGRRPPLEHRPDLPAVRRPPGGSGAPDAAPATRRLSVRGKASPSARSG
jgi:hypothetical protein